MHKCCNKWFNWLEWYNAHGDDPGTYKYNYCPQCGEKFTKYEPADIIYCKHCKHFERDQFGWNCRAPDNVGPDWYSENGESIRDPEDINMNNDCEWFNG